MRWCEFAYNEILIWSLPFTWLHYMFYSLQLFLDACLVKSSDLMLDVVAENLLSIGKHSIGHSNNT